MICGQCSGPVERFVCGKCGAWVAGVGAAGGPLNDDAFIDVLSVEAATVQRIVTGAPWDRSWGGGFCPSTVSLVGGNPGLGKSTLMAQLAAAFAEITGRPSYFVSAEQESGELRALIDRLQLPLKPGQLRVLKTFGSGGTITEDVLNKTPPGMIVLDSLSAICGSKNKDDMLAICKLYKKYAVKYRAPVFIIQQMMKEGDYAGRLDIQHEVDCLVTLDPIESDRKRERIFRDHGLDDADLRLLRTWKNRYGQAGGFEVMFLMTPRGLVALPDKKSDDHGDDKAVSAPAPERPTKTGSPLADVVLERQALEEEAREAAKEYRERIEELREQEQELAAKAEAPPPKRTTKKRARGAELEES